MSQQPFLSEIVNEGSVIPLSKLEYMRQRLRNNLYTFILNKYLERQESTSLTQAALARRIGYHPSRLNRVLGAPGNWTISTISDLLVGICGEELTPTSQPLSGRAQRNFSNLDHLSAGQIESQTRQSPLCPPDPLGLHSQGRNKDDLNSSAGLEEVLRAAI